jgi:hypothetical protein
MAAISALEEFRWNGGQNADIDRKIVIQITAVAKFRLYGAIMPTSDSIG